MDKMERVIRFETDFIRKMKTKKCDENYYNSNSLGVIDQIKLKARSHIGFQNRHCYLKCLFCVTRQSSFLQCRIVLIPHLGLEGT